MAPTVQLSAPAVTGELQAWFAAHTAALRPHLSTTGPGGVTVRLQVEMAAAHFRTGGDANLHNGVYMVLAAYRTAGLISRWRQAQEYATYLEAVARLLTDQGRFGEAAALLDEAVEERRLCAALDAAERTASRD